MNFHSEFLDLVKTKELPEITDFYQKNPHINLLFDEDSFLYEACVCEKVDVVQFLYKERQQQEPLFSIHCLILNVISSKKIELFTILFKWLNHTNENQINYVLYDNYLIEACKINNDVAISYLLDNPEYLYDYQKIYLYFLQVSHSDLRQKFENLYKTQKIFHYSSLEYYLIHCNIDFFLCMKKISKNNQISSEKYQEIIHYFLLKTKDKQLIDETVNKIICELLEDKKNKVVISRNIPFLLPNLTKSCLENELGGYILSAMYNEHMESLDYFFSLNIYPKHSFVQELEIQSTYMYRNYLEYFLFDFSQTIFEYFRFYIEDELSSYSLLLKAIQYQKLYIIKAITLESKIINVSEIMNAILCLIYGTSSLHRIEDFIQLNNAKNEQTIFEIANYFISTYEIMKKDTLFIVKLMFLSIEHFQKDHIKYYLNLLDPKSIKNKQKKEVIQLFEIYIKKHIYKGGKHNLFEIVDFLKMETSILPYQKINKLINEEINQEKQTIYYQFLSKYYQKYPEHNIVIHHFITKANNLDNLYRFLYLEKHFSFLEETTNLHLIQEFVNKPTSLMYLLLQENYDKELIPQLLKYNVIQLTKEKVQSVFDLENMVKLFMDGNLESIYSFCKIHCFEENLLHFLNAQEFDKEMYKIFSALLNTDKFEHIHFFINHKKNINLKKFTVAIINHIYQQDNVSLLKINVRNLIQKKNKKILTSFLVSIILKCIQTHNVEITSWCYLELQKNKVIIPDDKLIEIIDQMKNRWFHIDIFSINDKINNYLQFVNLLPYAAKHQEMLSLLLITCKIEYYNHIYQFKETLTLSVSTFDDDLEQKQIFIENKKHVLDYIIAQCNAAFIEYYLEEMYISLPENDIDLTSIFFNFFEDKVKFFHHKIPNFFQKLNLSFFRQLLEDMENSYNEYQISSSLLNIVKFLYSFDADYFGNLYNNEFFQLMIEFNYKDCAQYLLNEHSIEISANNEEAFKLACASGNVNMIKMLLNHNIHIDISNNEEEAMKRACKYGNLLAVKFLYKIKPSIDLSVQQDEMFHSSCTNGKINIAKWLYQYRGNNIHHDSILKYGLIGACKNGHLEVAKWLYNTFDNVDLTIDSDASFIEAAKNSKINVCHWIKSIYPERYTFVIENQYGYKEITSYKVDKNLELTEVQELENEAKECYICMSEKSTIITSCKHQTCHDCMNQYYKITYPMKCPYCRTEHITLYQIQEN